MLKKTLPNVQDRPAHTSRHSRVHGPSQQKGQHLRTPGSGGIRSLQTRSHSNPRPHRRCMMQRKMGTTLEAASDLSHSPGVGRGDKRNGTHLREEPRCPQPPGSCSEVSAGVLQRTVRSPTLSCKTQGQGPWPQSPSLFLLPCLALSVDIEND